jgi:hypothetical protein
MPLPCKMYIATINGRNRSGNDIVTAISGLKLRSAGLRVVRSLGALTFCPSFLTVVLIQNLHLAPVNVFWQSLTLIKSGENLDHIFNIKPLIFFNRTRPAPNDSKPPSSKFALEFE